jgi:NitT/TauT family transport system substrate-binding protein
MHSFTQRRNSLSGVSKFEASRKEKKRIFFALVATIALSVTLFFSLSSAALAQTRVVFGTPGSMANSSLAVFVAKDRGFYKEAGIDAEFIDFKGGAPAVQALLGGSIQYCICAPEHVVRLRTRNVDGVVAFALDTRHSYVLLVKDSSAAHKFGDLKGKRVGITSPGSLTENLLRVLAKRAGFAIPGDIELIAAGPGAPQRAALDTGRIEAGSFSHVDSFSMIGKGYRVLYDWRTQVVPSLALLSREKILAENPKISRAVVQATLRAQRLILSDKKVAQDALRKIYPNESEAEIVALADDLQTRLTHDGIYTPQAFDRLQADLVEIEPDLKKVDYNVANPRTYFDKTGP